MKSLLGARQRRILDEAARSRVLLAFDYDGTLAPIVSRPERAHMRPSTRRLLAKAAEAYPVAIITGRSRRSAMGFLDGVEVEAIVGNHGAEWGGKVAASPAVAKWHALLAQRLGAIDGIVLEDKGLSLSVHYRRCAEKAAARDAVLAAVRTLRGCRMVAGKDVVNLVPRDAPHKGDALLELKKQFACERVIFVGDDVTDEDVFALRRRARWLVSVRVGRSARSRAEYFVADQRALDELLRHLVAIRRRGNR